MGKRNSAAAAAKLTQAEAKVALAARRACTAAARATHAARVAKATAAAAALAARVYVPTKALPYIHPVDMSGARNVVRLARAASLQAVLAMRAIRMAAKAAAAVRAAKLQATAVVKAATTRATTATTARSTTADVRATRAAIVAFLAMTPCLCALWFYATLHIATKAAMKEVAKAANKVHAAIKAPRARLNDEAKRASITMACANARAAKAAKHVADAHAISTFGSVMSQRTIDARAAQGAEQRAINVMLKAHKAKKAAHKEIKALERSIMGVTPVVQVRVVRPIVAKLEGAHATDMARRHVVVAKEASYPEARGFRTSKLHPVMAPKTAANAAKREAAEKAAALVAARKAAKRLSRAEWLLQKAHRQALKEQYIALRAAKVNRICTEVWYKQGVWVDTFLVRACNDSDHDTRVAAMRELLALVGAAA